MFSYTDDAIVTSSPTGRHLSTVIRRPAAIGPLDWSEHADQVCKVLNELKAGAKAHSLSLHLQWCGRIYRPLPDVLAELRDFGALERAEEEFRAFAQHSAKSLQGARGKTARDLYADTLAAARIAELEKQLDDATTKLCAAQMLLEKPVQIDLQTADLRVLLDVVGVGSLLEIKADDGRTVSLKRVE